MTINKTARRYAPGSLWRSAGAGAISGAVSAFLFAFIHDVFISDIWFSAPVMMGAGALCGLALAWSYRMLVRAPSIAGWLLYNALFLVMLALLGAVSVLVFEPVTTIAALVTANAPPEALIQQALPLTLAFVLIGPILITLFYGWSWLRFFAVLLTTAILILLLGLNVSTIGLVIIPHSALYLIVELFGLILALAAAFAAIYILLDRSSLRPPASPNPLSPPP